MLLLGCVTAGNGEQRPLTATSASAANTCAIPRNEIRERFLQLVNAGRATARRCGKTQFNEAPPLAWNTRLTDAASVHAADMADNHFFSHAGSDGGDVAARSKRAGYTYRMIGENIAYAYPAARATMASTMQQWLMSPGHCANIMGADYTEIGIACAEGSMADEEDTRRYWVMVLGRPRRAEDHAGEKNSR